MPRGVIRHYTRTYAEGVYDTTLGQTPRGLHDTTLGHIPRGVIRHYTRTYGMPRGLHSKSSYVYNNTKTTTDLYEGLDDILNSSILTVVRHWLITDTDIYRFNCSCCRSLTN